MRAESGRAKRPKAKAGLFGFANALAAGAQLCVGQSLGRFLRATARVSGGAIIQARIMAITPFLRGQAFDPELVEAMGTAFTNTCDALGLTDRADPITSLVAEKIVELAQRGLRHP